MGSGGKFSEEFAMDVDVLPSTSKRSRFQPKISVKEELKEEPPSSPFPAPKPAQNAVKSISRVEKIEPSEDSYVSRFNGVVVGAVEEESSAIDVVEEGEGEDVVVKEFDVYLNPSIDGETKLYDMQYPLRPSWRPYEMNERCNQIRVKPKLSQFEIQLSLDVDSTENYNKQVDDSLMLTTQTLLSSAKSFVNEFAIGFLRGNKFYVNPLQSIVQFRPSKAYLDGDQMANQYGHQLESNLLPVENFKESPKVPNIKGKVVQDDAKEANVDVSIDEPWVLLEYHASDSPASCLYLEQTLTEGMNTPLTIKPSEYLHSYGLSTSRETTSPSKRYLLTLPLEDRLKQWLSEGPQVNRFVALLRLAPDDSPEDVLRLLQHHAYLVQGLWVSKSSLLHDGPAALYRDYLLFQFSKSHAVPDGKLMVVKPEHLRRSLLKPLAVERPLLKDWKFKEANDLSFIKQYPEIAKEQENAWSVREKKIMESLPGGGISIASLSRNPFNLSTSSKAAKVVCSIQPGHHVDRNDARSSVVADTMPSKGNEALTKAILELLRLHKVLSHKSIVQGLVGKSNGSLAEIDSVTNQFATKFHDLYVLKSLGKPQLDQFRNVVIEYFIAKGRYSKVKKQEIKLAAQNRLNRVVSDADYTQVMNELCMSTGGSWMLKSGALG